MNFILPTTPGGSKVWQDMPLSNMPLWHKNFFELKAPEETPDTKPCSSLSLFFQKAGNKTSLWKNGLLIPRRNKHSYHKSRGEFFTNRPCKSNSYLPSASLDVLTFPQSPLLVQLRIKTVVFATHLGLCFLMRTLILIKVVCVSLCWLNSQAQQEALRG